MRIKDSRSLAHFMSVLCVVTFCVCSAYVVLRSGAFGDDYSFLHSIQFDSGEPILRHNFKEGRYISGLLHYISFSNVSTVSGLVALRIASFFGMLATFLTLYITYRKSLSNTQILYLIPLLFSLPIFSQYLGFATTWAGFWGLCLSLVATKLLLNARRLLQASGFLLLLSLYFLSQLLPFWVFAFLAFNFLVNKSQLNEMLRLTLRVVYLQLLAGITSQVFRILINNQLNIEESGRIQLVSTEDITAKVYWFFSRIFVSVLRPYQIGSPSSFEAFLTSSLMFLLILFTFVLARKKFTPNKPTKIVILEFALIQALAILSLAPLLLWNQNQIEFRLIGAGSFVTVSILWVSLLQIMEVERKMFLNVGLLSLILFLVLLNVSRTLELRTKPFESKERFITSSIQHCEEAGKEGKLVIKMPEVWPKRNLLGDYSIGTDLQMSWVPIPNIKLTLKDIARAKVEAEVYVSTGLSYSQEDCLINFTDYVNRNWMQLSHDDPLKLFLLNLTSNKPLLKE